MLVKTLNQKNPCLDREHLLDLLAMYEGGKCFEKRLQRFLPRNPSESDKKYNARLQQAPYRSYIGPIIDKFAALLLASPPNAQVLSKNDAQEEPPDFWLKWRDDVDGCGTDCREFFREQFTDGLMKCRSLWAVNKPEGAADNAKEWDDTGLGNITLKELETQDVINWKVDAFGRLEWLVYHETEAFQVLPTEPQGKSKDTWTIYYRDKTEVYELTYETAKGYKDDAVVPLVSAIQHDLDELPIIALIIPKGLCVAERLYSPQLEHFRLSAALSWAFKASCYAMPVFKTQDGKPPNMGEGNTVVLATKSDDGAGEESIDWLAPPTAHLSVMRDEISSQKDEIHRIVHQMAEAANNQAGTASRSALSKIQDSKSTNIILESYATLLRDAIQKTYRLAARLRGEDIDWVITGLDRFEGLDLSALIESILGINEIGIDSETFHVEAQSLIVDEILTNIDEHTRGKIRDEIKAGVAAKKKQQLEEQKQRSMLLHGLGNDLEGPEGKGPPGQGKANAGGGHALPGKRGQLPLAKGKNAAPATAT